MKKLTIYVLFLTVLTACSDDLKISRNLDGDWQVERLESEVYTTTPNETRTFENIGTISFDHCSRSDRNDNIGRCLGGFNIVINNETMEGTFSFVTDINRDSNNISDETEYEWVIISAGDGSTPVSLNLSLVGNWKIESLTDDNCTLAKETSGAFQRLYLKR